MSDHIKIEELKTRHQELEAQLEALISSPTYDDIQIAEIKKEKLLIKDELASLES